MPLTYVLDTAHQVIEFTIRGVLTAEDYLAVFEPMQGFARDNGRIRVIEIIDSFAGFDGPAPIEEMPATATADNPVSYVTHVALVSDIGWFCPILSQAPATWGIELRWFQRSQLHDARQWVWNT